MALAAFYFRASRPIISFGLCWFVFTLAPALNLNKVALNFFTERYLYIPSVGFSILMASAGIALFSCLTAPAARIALSTALAGLLVFYLVQTERRVAIFHDNYTLLSATEPLSPNSTLSRVSLQPPSSTAAKPITPSFTSAAPFNSIQTTSSAI